MELHVPQRFILDGVQRRSISGRTNSQPHWMEVDRVSRHEPSQIGSVVFKAYGNYEC